MNSNETTKSALSKSAQVTGLLQQLIVREKMQAGDQLPTEAMLAERLNVSRVTVRTALHSLAKEGIILRHRGRGTFLSNRFDLTDVIREQNRNAAREYTVGIVLAVLNDDYFRRIAAACEQKLKTCGMKPVCWAISSAEEIRSHFNEYRQLDGLVINPPDLESSQVLRRELPHVPMVFVNEAASENHDGISSNDYDGAMQIVNFLYVLGHRHIAHLHGPLNTVSGIERNRGYIDAMRERGLEDCIQTVPGEYNFEKGYSGMKSLLEKTPAPDAVFCANDTVASGAYAAIRDAGLKIPDDISVFGYGNQRVGVELSPRLCTCDQHPELIGMLAAERLLEMVYGYPSDRSNTKLPVSLIFRDSCKVLNSN